jgi:hypothetical protein
MAVTNRDYLGNYGKDFDKHDGGIISFWFDYERSESDQSGVSLRQKNKN